MHDPRDVKLDISSLPASETEAQPDSIKGQPYISVLFACCTVYQRIYRKPSQSTYSGRCPRCGRTIRFEVGPGGTTQRSFIAR